MGWFQALRFATTTYPKVASSLCNLAYQKKGYLKEQRYYNNTTHNQIHSSSTIGIDGLPLPFYSIFGKGPRNADIALTQPGPLKVAS